MIDRLSSRQCREGGESMAKFNIEVELDWLDEETAIDEEIRERVIRGAENYLLQATTDEIEKKIDNLVGKKLLETEAKIDEIVDKYLDVVCQAEIEKMKIPQKESDWSNEVKMIPIQEFIGIRFNRFCNEKRYNSDFKETNYSSERKFSLLEKDIQYYLHSVLSKQVSDIVRKAQENVEKEIVSSLEQTLKQNLAEETVKKMNIPKVLEKLQNNYFLESEDK